MSVLRGIIFWKSYLLKRCHETPHRAHRAASRRARRVTGRFTPSSVLPLHLFDVSCLFSCLFS